MAGVFNGQPVSAEVTNPAFIIKNADDVTPSKLGLANSAPESGGSITNNQKELNSINSFIGKITNTPATALPPWNNNQVGMSTDPLFERLDDVTLLFAGSSGSGHLHRGVDGDGPSISVAAVGNPAIHGDVLLQAGSNVSLTQSANTIIISASSGGGGGGGSSDAIWNPADAVSISNVPVTGSIPLTIDGVVMGSPVMSFIDFALQNNTFSLDGTVHLAYAQPFICPAPGVADVAKFSLFGSGSPVGNLNVLIVGDLNGAPDLGNVIGTSGNVAASSISTVSFVVTSFSGIAALLTLQQKYWVVIQGDATYNTGAGGGDTIVIQGINPPGSYPFSNYYDGISWTSFSNAITYHVETSGSDIGSRVLLTAQTSDVNNGIYDYSDNGSTYTLVRSSDAQVSGDFKNGKLIEVANGVGFGESLWSLNAQNPVALNTSKLKFSPLAASIITSVGASAGLSITAGSPILFDVITSDPGSHYDSSTGEFTAPVAGLYSVQTSLYTGGALDYQIWKNGSNYVNANSASNPAQGLGIALIPLLAGDTLTVVPTQTSTISAGAVSNFFNVVLQK